MEKRASVLLLLCCYLYALSGRVSAENEQDFSILPGDIVVRRSFPARLDCMARNVNDFVDWVGENSVVYPNNDCNCQLLLNGSLYFPSIRPRDSGTYTCAIPPGFSMVNGSITVAAPPVINFNFDTFTYTEGENVVLPVDITGTPAPTVTWQKDGVDISNVLQLSIPSVGRSQAGTYSVIASNIEDTVTRPFTLFVRFAPSIAAFRIPDTDMVGTGITATINCSATSHPASLIRWESQNSNTETASSNINIPLEFHTVSTSAFMFGQSDFSGAIKYCCIAENSIGADTHCFNFSQLGTPGSPTEFRAMDITSTSITASWNEVVLDGVMYRFEYHELPEGSATGYDLPRGRTSFTVGELTPDTQYQFSILSSSNGLSSLPVTFTAKTLVTAPETAQGIRYMEMDDGSVRLEWEAPPDSVVDHYIVRITIPTTSYSQSIEVPGNTTSLDLQNLMEDMEYVFSVETVNEGGTTISSSLSAIFCFNVPVLSVPSYEICSDVLNFTWDLNIDLGISARGVVFRVTDETNGNRLPFESKQPVPIGAGHHCISGLEQNTRYSMIVIAMYNCGQNSTALVDFQTADVCNNEALGSSDNCTLYEARTSAAKSSSTIKPWLLAVIVCVPVLLAVVVMLGIGIYCAFRHNRSNKFELASNSSQQAPLNHLRNNSSSSYSGSRPGSITPTRSALNYSSKVPYKGTWNDPIGLDRIEEQSTGTSV